MCAAALKSERGILLQCFGYVAGTNAARTNFNSHDAAILYCSYLLQVWIPYSAGFIVGVAHVIAKAGPFSTNIAFS
jgi:hypothetical protein